MMATSASSKAREKPPLHFSNGPPGFPLPTVRMSFDKQIGVMRAYPTLCGSKPRAVTSMEIARLVDVAHQTVSHVNRFLVGIGLLEKAEGGSCMPGPELMAYALAYKWEQDKAHSKLAPVFQKAWFCSELIPKLRFRTMTEPEVVQDLAEQSALGPEYAPQLKMVLNYLCAVGIIIRDNGTIRLREGDGAVIMDDSAGETNVDQPAATRPLEINSNKSHPPETNGRAAHPVRHDNTIGPRRDVISLSVDFEVDVNKMRKWTPERITAFLNGLAAVLAAQRDDTKDDEM